MAWLSAASIAITCGPGAAWSWPQRGLGLLESAQEGLETAPRLVELLALAGLPLMLVCGLASALALLLRFRRSRGVERQQLKWFAFAGAVTIAGLVLLVVPSQYGWIGPVHLLVSLPLLLSMPVAAGIAILRYRLYDIDRIISRTVVYGLLTVLLGATYAGVVLVLGQLFGGIGGEPPSWAVAGATLAVAALFQPADGASRLRSTGTSTGVATTPPRPSRRSAPGCATRSTWRRCRPSCWPWWTRRCSPVGCHSGCDRARAH